MDEHEKQIREIIKLYRETKNNNMNTYILQKDLPNLKAGAFFVWSKSKDGIVEYFSFLSKDGNFITFLPEEVENNPEWFKLKEERVYSKPNFAGMYKGIHVKITPIQENCDMNIFEKIRQAYKNIVAMDEFNEQSNDIEIVSAKDWYIKQDDICFTVPIEVPKEIISKIRIIKQ